MPLFKRSPEVEAMREADAAPHANQRQEEAAGIDYETPEYRELNAKANDAADKVSWWRGGNKR